MKWCNIHSLCKRRKILELTLCKTCHIFTKVPFKQNKIHPTSNWMMPPETIETILTTSTTLTYFTSDITSVHGEHVTGKHGVSAGVWSRKQQPVIWSVITYCICGYRPNIPYLILKPILANTDNIPITLLIDNIVNIRQVPYHSNTVRLLPLI